MRRGKADDGRGSRSPYPSAPHLFLRHCGVSKFDCPEEEMTWVISNNETRSALQQDRLPHDPPVPGPPCLLFWHPRRPSDLVKCQGMPCFLHSCVPEPSHPPPRTLRPTGPVVSITDGFPPSVDRNFLTDLRSPSLLSSTRRAGTRPSPAVPPCSYGPSSPSPSSPWRPRPIL